MGAFGDAAVYPPEVTYQIMSSGDQGASLIDAAAGHQTVAAMLVAEMTAMGLNTSSTAMVAWQGAGGAAMEMTAGQFIEMCEAVSMWCQEGSVQAAAVAEAHGMALAQMVPAEVCLANRTELATLVSTNFLGVNTPAIGVNNAEYAGYWITNATQRSAYSGMVTASNVATATPAPFAPMVTNPAGPAESVAQAAAQDTGEQALQASAKTMTQASEAPAKGSESMGGQMAGQLGGIVGQLGSGFGQVTQMGQQLPQMLGQAPQMFQGLLGPLTQGMGLNGAASLAPEAAGAIAPASSLGGVGGLGGALGGAGGGGGLSAGTAGLSSSFVRPAGSFNTPNSPTLPAGWQGGPGADASARTGGSGGGLYGAPPASMMGAGRGTGSESDQKAGRTMQVSSRGANRGERQRI